MKDRQQKKPCARCKGSGKEPNSKKALFCLHCKGLGFVLLNQRIKLI